MDPLRCLALGLLLVAAGCGGAKHEAVADKPRPGGYPQPGHLLPLLRVDNPKLEGTAALMAAAGNEREKTAASNELIRMAQSIASDGWREAQRPAAERMSGGKSLTRTQQNRWLDDWQKRHLVRVYDAMQALGTDMLLDHCRAVVKDEARWPTQRKLALAVLAAHQQVSNQPRTDQPWAMPGSGLRSGSRQMGPTTTFPGAPTGYSSQTGASQRANSVVDVPTVEGGKIINANEIVAALNPYFLQCYERAMQRHGRLGAWIILKVQVNSAGRVAAVTGSGDDSVPYEMMECLRAVVRQAQFARPQGGEARVSIPLSFTAPPGYGAPSG